MRLALAELAPRAGDVGENLRRVEAVAASARAELAVFPELFLTGYRIGDRFHQLAMRPGDPTHRELGRIAAATGTGLVVGAPLASPDRPGELVNAALVVRPDGSTDHQAKRYLPTFGPFEEGVPFSPGPASAPVGWDGHRLGLQVCYDVFFPEVSRELALAGARLLVAISAAPVTSRRLFDRLLPARAIENGLPVVYVNRVGVEDGMVFGGGSGVWDPRGEPVDGRPVELVATVPEESVRVVDLDPTASDRWRPFRPVLRDVAAHRTGPAPSGS